MRREVEQGHSLLVFREGRRTKHGRVGPFQQGVFQRLIAARVDAYYAARARTFQVADAARPSEEEEQGATS